MIIGKKNFELGKKTFVMGIVNVTPDSFSDGGNYDTVDNAIKHCEQLIQEGADILDIGGESTRPGYEKLTDEEEIARVVPVIREIKKRFDIPISIDTYKAKVARAAIEAGADLLNDIWGLKYDDDIAKVASEHKVTVCLMHNRKEIPYDDFMTDVVADLQESIQIALEAGISKDKIILDPGVGFAKTYEQNLEVMNHLEDIVAMGYPVLLGTSRKSMIGITLDLPVDQREEGTIATSVIGAMKGCDFVRVHNVLGNARALKMTDAIGASAVRFGTER